MFVDKLSKVQQEEYLRTVVLGQDFDDREISGISCDCIDEANSLNKMYNMSYVLEEKYDDSIPAQCEQEILEYDTNLEHLRFMISKFGIDYLSSLKSYAKTPEAKGVFSGALLKKCDQFLVQTMCRERKVVGLDNFSCEVVEADGVSQASCTEMERQ